MYWLFCYIISQWFSCLLLYHLSKCVWDAMLVDTATYLEGRDTVRFNLHAATVTVSRSLKREAKTHDIATENDESRRCENNKCIAYLLLRAESWCWRSRRQRVCVHSATASSSPADSSAAAAAAAAAFDVIDSVQRYNDRSAWRCHDNTSTPHCAASAAYRYLSMPSSQRRRRVCVVNWVGNRRGQWVGDSLR